MNIFEKWRVRFVLRSRPKYILRFLVFIFPAVFVLSIAVLKCCRLELYKEFITREDGAIEYGTCVPYFVAAILAVFIAYRFGKRHLWCALLYSALSLVFIIICMEELSWGQRIFNIRTPAFFSNYNKQKELNLHNLISGRLFHSLYIMVGFYGSFGRVIWDKYLRKMKYSRILNIDYFVPDYLLALYFFPVFALHLYYDYINHIAVYLFGDNFAWWKHPEIISAKDQEPIEFLLALGFMLFVIINYHRQKRKKDYGTNASNPQPSQG